MHYADGRSYLATYHQLLEVSAVGRLLGVQLLLDLSVALLQLLSDASASLLALLLR